MITSTKRRTEVHLFVMEERRAFADFPMNVAFPHARYSYSDATSGGINMGVSAKMHEMLCKLSRIERESSKPLARLPKSAVEFWRACN